ncbi:MAG: ABC transporter permease, partial [Coriobacteriia bacterium]
LAAADRAASYAALTGPLARTSLGLSFWLMLLAAYLVLFSARSALASRAERAIVLLAFPLAALALLATGSLGELAVLREYANTREAFWEAFRQHLAYVGGATGISIVLGVVLGVWSARRRAAEAAVFGVLNVAQVMPALAFIGLLIPPMSWLGDNVGIADFVGISGIGWAPVFLVLVSYALYPITRNTYSAMRTLDAGIVDAARGMGMNAWQRLTQVELPLAFPVVLAGIRIALVQTTAGSIIAALVGGGGLGRIVFYGLEQTAEDLVLLGVAPIVLLALTFDATLRAIGDSAVREEMLAQATGEGNAA